MISRAVARIKEDERPGSKPAIIRIQKPDFSSHGKLNFIVNELKADDTMVDLSFHLSSMTVNIDGAELGTKTHKLEDELRKSPEDIFLCSQRSDQISRSKGFNDQFNYTSFLEYLRQTYPSVHISPSKKGEGKIEDELAGNKVWQLPEKVVSDDFIGIGDKKTVVRDQADEEDIVDKVDNSLLPTSLKEKFKIDLLKIKKKDFTTKVVEKKQNKTNTMQSTSREIFEKGNVFEVLKTKAADQMSDDEGNSQLTSDEDEEDDETDKKKTFWEAYNEANEKHLSGKKDSGPRVGEFGGGGKAKKKKDKPKTAQFSKPSIRSAIKF